MGNDGKGSGFFGGFILGGIIGAIAAFFLSQKGGRDSFRSKFSEVVSHGRETIREAIDEGKEAAARKESEFQAGLDEEDK